MTNETTNLVLIFEKGFNLSTFLPPLVSDVTDAANFALFKKLNFHLLSLVF